MDRKSIIVLVASFGLLFVWFQVVPKLYPPIQKPPPTNLATAATNRAAAAPQTNVSTPQLPPSAALTNLAAPLVAPGAPEQIEKIETSDAIYTFTGEA